MKLSHVLEVLGATLIAAASANAITVQEVGVNPYETPTISCTGIGNNITVYAGVNQLVVGGVAMNGFCIDPFHYSLASSSGYSYVPLTSAPKGYVMSADVALDIQRLWGSYYSPSMTASSAAGLQIAIWELVGGSNFTLNSANDFGAAGYVSAVQDANYSGPVADLIALTGPGQDYVVAAITGNASPVPDGGATLILLGGALCGLCLLRRTMAKA